MKLIRMILVCVLLSKTAPTEAKEWRGIVPLNSTRADVERLLGPPVSDTLSGPCQCLYKLEDATVHVIYANGLPCGAAEQRDWRVGGWRVPRDTVVEIAVYFRTEQQFDKLNIDETKYEKVTNRELPGLLYLINTEEGISIEAGGNRIRSIRYFASAKDNKLRCYVSPLK